MTTDRWNQEAGERRKRVTIEQKNVATTDTLGHPTRTWEIYAADVSTTIFTPTGRKLEIARQLVSSATHQMEMLYRPLDANIHRINYKGRIFAIGHVNDVDEMHVKMILTLTEQYPAS